jgi:hypothetical protein
VRLFAGGLAFSMRDADLREVFARCLPAELCEVADAKVMLDRADPTRSKGFGFVTLTPAAGRSYDDVRDRSILQMNGMDVQGRSIKVNSGNKNDGPPAPAAVSPRPASKWDAPGAGKAGSLPGGGGGGGGAAYPPVPYPRCAYPPVFPRAAPPPPAFMNI